MKRTVEEKTIVGVRMPVWLKKELSEISEKSERTLTQQVLFILKLWISEQSGKPSK